MDRHQITKVYAERPGFFLIAMAIMAGFILGLIFFAYYVLTGHRDRDGLRMGVTCTDWTYESRSRNISAAPIFSRCASDIWPRAPRRMHRGTTLSGNRRLMPPTPKWKAASSKL